MPGWKHSALREHSGAGGSRNFVSVLRWVNNIPAIRAEMDLPATDSRLIEAHTCDQSRDGFAGDTDSDCRCAFVSNCRNIFVDLCHRICVDKNLRLMPEESEAGTLTMTGAHHLPKAGTCARFGTEAGTLTMTRAPSFVRLLIRLAVSQLCRVGTRL